MNYSTQRVLVVWVVFGLTSVFGPTGTGFGGSALGQIGGGGTFGSRTLGGNVAGGQGGAGGTAGNRLSQAQQGAGQITGNERFLRDSRGAGSFVGADSGDTQNFFSQQNQNAANRGGQNISGGRNTNQRNNNFSQMSQQRILRRRLHVNFSYMPRRTIGIDEVLAQRIDRITRDSLDSRSLVQVTMENTTVVLRGTVASDEQRLLFEKLARLEPGVWDVRNELVVVAGSSTRSGEAMSQDQEGPSFEKRDPERLPPR